MEKLTKEDVVEYILPFITPATEHQVMDRVTEAEMIDGDSLEVFTDECNELIEDHANLISELQKLTGADERRIQHDIIIAVFGAGYTTPMDLEMWMHELGGDVAKITEDLEELHYAANLELSEKCWSIVAHDNGTLEAFWDNLVDRSECDWV